MSKASGHTGVADPASPTVLVWGDDLHPDVRSETSIRCVHVSDEDPYLVSNLAWLSGLGVSVDIAVFNFGIQPTALDVLDRQLALSRLRGARHAICRVDAGWVEKIDEARTDILNLPSAKGLRNLFVIPHSPVAFAETVSAILREMPGQPDSTEGDGENVVADQFRAEIVWHDSTPMFAGRRYDFEMKDSNVEGTVTGLKSDGEHTTFPGADHTSLQAGQFGDVELSMSNPITTVAHRKGDLDLAFRVRSPSDARVMGFGMIRATLQRSGNITPHHIIVDRAARAAIKGQKPAVIWFTGLSGSGKSTIANALDQRLHEEGYHTALLDGDNVRNGLNRDLGFSDADRVENIRRIGEVAKLMSDAGLIVMCSFISPFSAERNMVRDLMGEGEFIEVFVDTPLHIAEARDPKGLYKRARAGEIRNFTGIDSEYQIPQAPELSIETMSTTPEHAASLIMSHLKASGRLYNTGMENELGDGRG